MTYSLSQSETKKAARVPLSHATDCLRVSATAAACSRPLSRTMFASESNSSSVLTSPRINSRRLAGFIPRKWVLRTTARIVSSADGAGISEASEGGSPTRSGIGFTPTGRALTRDEGMRSGKGSPVESKSATFPQVNPLLPQKERAGLNPDPSLLPIVPRQPSQGCRCISVLRQRRPFAAVSASHKFARTDLHSPLEAYADHVRHLSFLYPSGKPVRPRLVQST